MKARFSKPRCSVNHVLKNALPSKRSVFVMRNSFRKFIEQNPLRRQYPFTHHSGYFIVDLVIALIWILQIFSPAAWISTIFSHKGKDGRYHSNPLAIEMYLSFVFLFGWYAAFMPTEYTRPNAMLYVILSAILLIEIVQYHFYLILIRPAIDATYRQYSSLRTILLTIMAYVNVVNYFSIIYLHGLWESFPLDFKPWSAWAFSVGEISGSGYSGTKISPDLWVSIVSGTEKFVGVFFLAVIIALALIRISMPEIGIRYKEYDPTSKKDD